MDMYYEERAYWFVGQKEFNANLYPEEPVKKLWSLLKLHDKEYNLTPIHSPHKQLERGSIGENFKDNDLLLIISKTNNATVAKEIGSKSSTDQHLSKRTGSKSSTNDQSTKIKSEVKTPTSEGTTKDSRSSKTEVRRSSFESTSHKPGASTKTATEVTTTSRDGSNITNVSININIDPHTSNGERGQVNKTKQEPSKNREVSENGGDSHTGTRQLSYAPQIPKDRLNALNLPITPKTRAKALSEHLSQSSLHTRKSFQSTSYRDSPIRGSVHMEPVLMDKEEQDTNVISESEEHSRTVTSKESFRRSPHSSENLIPNQIIHPKTSSNNQKGDEPSSKEGINAATLPRTIPSSQSMKHFDRKATSKSSLKGRISVSKLSLEKKVRRGSSKSFTVESLSNTNSLANKSSRSPSQPPSATGRINIEIHSPSPQDKRVDRDQSERSGSKGGNTSDYSPPVAQQGYGVSSRPPRSSWLDNKAAETSGVSVGQNGKNKVGSFDTKNYHSPINESVLLPDGKNVKNISNNKDNSQEKDGIDETQTTEKRISSSEDSKQSDPKSNEHREYPEYEVVTPMVTDLVHNYNEDASSNVNAAGDRSDEMEENINTLAMRDQKESKPKKSNNTGKYDDDSLSTQPKVGGERIISPQKPDEDVVKSEIKVPNEDPPHIKQSDADLSDEKEAVVSSVNHESKYEYDKHDSEQEFKRLSPTNTTKITTNVENDQDRKKYLEPINKHEKKDAVSSNEKKAGSKIKKRKSPGKDEKEKRKYSQELPTSNESGEENMNLTSPVISKEDIGGENTKA